MSTLNNINNFFLFNFTVKSDQFKHIKIKVPNNETKQLIIIIKKKLKKCTNKMHYEPHLDL